MNTTVEHDQTNTVNNTFTETIKSDTTVKITEGRYSHDVVANTAVYHVQGALTENYDTNKETTVKGKVIIKSTAGVIEIWSDKGYIKLDAATSIDLHTGASKLSMLSNGNIVLEGKNITINGAGSIIKVDATGVSVSGPKISLNG
jgi:type VI secretion system secreted protein VgrG